MLRALDALFEFCASLKLAVLVILTIATLLGIATFYEARYGMAAVQQLVYGSNLFIASMALLAVNVMAAAVIRYPWKRKQTGFVITHLGILVLLAGCLISFRTSVDGRVAFRPGDTHDDIAQINEVMQLSVGGKNWTLPVNFWAPAGYPSAARALLPNWPEPTWVGPNPTYTLADGVQLEVLEWLPAAKIVRGLTPEPTGTPAAEIRISGTTPAEIPVEEKVLLVLPRGETGTTQSIFGGILEVALWTTTHPSDVAAFLAPPTPASLGELGTLTVSIGNTVASIPVTRDPATITRLPSGHQVSILEYLPQAAIDGNQLLPAGPEPVAPILRARILNPDNTTHDHLVSARHPYLSLQTSPPSTGKPTRDAPRFRFDHPAMYTAIADGTRGRLHLLQGPDGTLYYRAYANEGVRASGKLTPGDTELAKWMGLAASVTSHLPAAIVTESYARAYVPPAKLNEAMRAMRVAVTVDGKRREAWIARGAAPKGVDSPRGVATLAYGFEALKLPFSLAMLDAKKINNPGTTDAAAYESSMIVNHPDGTTHRQTITMNQPLTVGNLINGFTFYQAGFDDGLGAPISTLSVRRDPGTIPKYLGSFLICLGIFLMFYMKAYFQKPIPPTKDDHHGGTENHGATRRKQEAQPEPALTHARLRTVFSYLRSSAFICGFKRISPCPSVSLRASVVNCIVLFATMAIPGFVLAQDLDPLRTIPVLDGGRIKPLDSVARESVRIMTGRESFQRNDPLALVFSIHRDPVSWESRPLIHVPYLSLRTMIGLPADVQYATPAQVRSSEPYRAFLAAVIAKQRSAAATSEDPRLTREETAATELSNRIHMYDALVSGEHFGILPAHANASALDHDPWRTVDRLAAATDPASRAVFAAWQKVVLSSKDPASNPPASAAESLRLAVSSAVGPNYANPALLSREVAYHALHPFRIAWIAYLITLAVLCASLMIKSPWVYRAGMALLIASIAWSIFAFAWRCSITGWAPVTNIYETVIWVALVGSVVAVCIEFAHGGKTAAIAGTIGAIAAGLVADIMPPEFGASVQNLAPVLRSNLWLTVHVLTIVSSYAAFLVALVLGNILLAQFAWRPASKASIALNLKHLNRSLQVGVLLVAAGTILGGLWADVSWGRFWGWDPKEVWALIILLVYLALLHGRMAGWVGTWGLAAGSVVAFLTVLMSWYGVNFVLGAGLHSYGFGTGGQLYVAIFCLLQLAYVAVCYFARRAHTPSTAPQTSSDTPADPMLPPSKSLSSAK